MTEPSDRQLVDRIVRTGDESAFRALYRRHTPVLYRIAVRLTDDRDGIAEDLVHDTWIRASERWTDFGWRSSLGTWLTGILINRIREARRAWARRPTEALELEAAVECPPPDDQLDLEAAVARLAPGYRAVVILHDIEGFTHEEIAAQLGTDAGTSKSQLSRARRALRRWLEPRWSTP